MTMFDIRDHGGNYDGGKKKSKMPFQKLRSYNLSTVNPTVVGSAIPNAPMIFLASCDKYIVNLSNDARLTIVEKYPYYRIVASIAVKDGVSPNGGGIIVNNRYLIFRSNAKLNYLVKIDLQDELFTPTFVLDSNAFSYGLTNASFKKFETDDYNGAVYIVIGNRLVKYGQDGNVAWFKDLINPQQALTIVGLQNGRLLIQNTHNYSAFNVLNANTGELLIPFFYLTDVQHHVTSGFISSNGNIAICAGSNLYHYTLSADNTVSALKSSISGGRLTSVVEDVDNENGVIVSYNGPGSFPYNGITHEYSMPNLTSVLRYMVFNYSLPRIFLSFSKKNRCFVTPGISVPFGSSIANNTDYHEIHFEEE